MRADIERQLALWRKCGRWRPAQRPRGEEAGPSTPGIAAPAPAPAALPPAQVDEAGVAQMHARWASRGSVPSRRSSNGDGGGDMPAREGVN